MGAKQADITLHEAASLGLPEDSVTDAASQFRHLLFYDEGTSWRFTDDSGEWIVFFFKWDNPRLSRLGGAYHSPERCLPNTGWRLTAAPEDIEMKISDVDLPATISHFRDSQRTATLLFAHWALTGEKLGVDTKLDPQGRLEDFANRKRMDKRRAVQVALISNLSAEEAKAKLVEFAQRALAKD